MTERKILKNKIFLYLTEFFAGMSVMAIELGAQRLLAPYFSSSQIVWTLVIGTIMIAMALGNIYGGRKADKDPNPDELYARIIIAGIWIVLIPWLGKYVIAGISALLIFAVNTGFLVIAATVSCLVLFIFPLFLLGTTTPCLVKYCISSIDESGKTVGALNACNTIGSILGTFLPTFVTIPAMGTNMTFLLFGIILLALAFVYFISSKIFSVKMGCAILAVILGVIFGHSSHFAFWENNLVYEGESTYNYLQVYEDSSKVSLSTNVLFGVQSVRFKDKGLHSGYYYDYDLAAYHMVRGAEREKVKVLILGMGSGTYASQMNLYFDNVDIVGVEIDQKITDLAREYFALDENIEVYTYDGRAYLNAIKDEYDIIMVDAYQDITIPYQMSSIEFFTLVKNHLASDGVMVVNLNMRSDKEGNINYYICDTIARVFKYNYTIDVSRTTNRELFAFNSEKVLDNLADGLSVEKDTSLKKFLTQNVSGKLMRYNNGDLLLTDDKAPVELLGISVIDMLIQNETEYYRDIFRREGLKGLLEELS